MKKLWMKVGTIALATMMMVGGICLNTMAATEEEIAAAQAQLTYACTHGGFETGAVVEDGNTKTYPGAYSPGGGWEHGGAGNKFDKDTVASDDGSIFRTMAIVSDTEKYPELANQGHALKMINPYNDSTASGVEGFSLAWGARVGVYSQLPGQTYRVSAKVYLNKGNLTDDIGAVIGIGFGSEANKIIAYKTIYGTEDTYNSWIDLSFYSAGRSASASSGIFVYLSTDVGERRAAGYEGHTGYVLWDDIKIEAVDTVSFEKDAKVEGGGQCKATLLMSNTEASSKNYTVLKSVYAKETNNTLVLKKVLVESVTVPATSTYKAGQYLEDIAFDLTEYTAEDDYVVKVMVWEKGVSDMKPAYIGELD